MSSRYQNSEESQLKTWQVMSRRVQLWFRHSGIQRFGVITGIFGLCFSILMPLMLSSILNRGAEEFATRAIYTKGFVSSISRTQGSVVGVYRDASSKDVLVLMRFASPEMVSQNAKDYKAFIIGVDGVPTDKNLELTNVETPKVKGRIISFGDNGYIGVMLSTTNETGFEPQALNVTMRATNMLNKNISASDKVKGKAVDGDTGFEKFDQWRVVVNPVAKESVTIKGLSRMTLRQIMVETVARKTDEAARAQMDKDLVKMRSLLGRIKEDRRKLSTMTVDDRGVVINPLPQGIAGDEITCAPKPGPAPAGVGPGADLEPMSLDRLKQLIADRKKFVGENSDMSLGQVPGTTYSTTDDISTGEIAAPSDGSTKKTSEEECSERLSLLTTWVDPGGWSFDWRSHSITNDVKDDRESGYLVKALPNKDTPATTYLSLKSKLGTSISTPSMLWRLSDGTVIYGGGAGQVFDSSLPNVASIRATISDLEQTQNQYLALKKRYQTKDYQVLLRTELILDQARSTSSEGSTDAVKVFQSE